MLVRMPQRNFSLLTPLQQAAKIPADATSLELTEEHYDELQAYY